MGAAIDNNESKSNDSHQALLLKKFCEIDLSDPFFDSLKADYREFEDWFRRKANNEAFVFRADGGKGLDGFLYLKVEDGAIDDVVPSLAPSRRIKVGTFKINPHGTRLGERFIKRAFDVAVSEQADALYVTIFQKHDALVQLFKKYGFREVGIKPSGNGTELVLERRLDITTGDIVQDYPRIPLVKNRHFILSIRPEWHSRLLPDSMLKTEDASILQDVSHTNSIHKIYLTRMTGVEALRRGDTLVIYRMQDGGSAYHTSVVSSLCVVEELTHISTFRSATEFRAYCEPYSIFSEEELETFFKTKKYEWLIRFTYNLAFTRRVNRRALIEEVGLDAGRYWGFFQLATNDLRQIVKLSGDYEKTRSLIYTS